MALSKIHYSMIGAPVWQDITANYNAVSGDHLRIDSTSGTFTITLPATPNDDDQIEIVDVSGMLETNNVTIERNNKTIMTLSENLNLDKNYSFTRLVYDDETNNWTVNT